ncbi:MAG: hypothetical protein FD122_259 [Stygiobacter sp.]|nr:MAG: hypothetical protein FD122_259 [Stygiobacter sp.]KAF0214594.1 MAG: hypothetical protein FD178_2285 [Ignavibacteria bacterium]
MKPILAFLFSAIVLFLFNSCKDNGSEPVTNNIKSPLEMTWTVDTLFYEQGSQTIMNSIYASSPRDVWVSGHSDVSYGSMWHYDGTKWSIVDIMIGNARSAYSLRDISGLSSSNIWVAGIKILGAYPFTIKNLVFHYNGVKWIDCNSPVIGFLATVYAESQTNIWSGGQKGSISHFDGYNWLVDTIKLKATDIKDYSIKRIVTYKNQLFILITGNDPIRAQSAYYVTGKMKNWNIVDSMVTNVYPYTYTSGDYDLYVTPSNRLLSFGNKGIWEYKSGKWESLYYDQTKSILAVHGVSDNYLIGAGNSSYAMYYDGSVWRKIEQITNTGRNVQFEAVWTDGKEVFIVGVVTGGFPNKTVIWHGK